MGAVGVAVLLSKQLTGFTVIQRSRKGTGFDYWLGDEDELPLQNKGRAATSPWSPTLGMRCEETQESLLQIEAFFRMLWGTACAVVPRRAG
jgi:hypothetical protein